MDGADGQGQDNAYMGTLQQYPGISPTDFRSDHNTDKLAIVHRFSFEDYNYRN